MQTFNQKKIVLAVGASLLAMAGTAQAAVSVAERAVKPVLVTAVTAGTGAAGAHKLYNGEGYTGTLTVRLNFTAGASALTYTGSNLLDTPLVTAGDDGFRVNGAVYQASFTSTGSAAATSATDDVSVYAGTGASAIPLGVTNLGFTTNVAGGTGATTAATAAITLDANTTAASGAFRMNAAGALEWISNVANVLTGTWLPVSIQVNQATGAKAIQAHDRFAPESDMATAHNYGAAVGLSGATLQLTHIGLGATIASAAAESIFSAVLPAPIVATKTPATNVGLVDGVTINTLTPLVGFAASTVAASASTTGGNACLTAITEATTTTTVVPTASTNFTALAGTNFYTIAGATTSASLYSVTLSAPTTAFSGTYTASCFNTGVTQLPVKLEFNAGAVAASFPTYSLVFNATTGSAATAAALGITAATVLADGAAPVVTKAEYTNAASPATTAGVTLTFSEPMAFLSASFAATAGAAPSSNSNLREIAENVKFGGDSLAALNLNAGGNLQGGTVAAPNTGVALNVENGSGLGKLTLNGVQQTDAVKALTVTTGIALMEQSDPDYSATVPKLDNVFTNFAAATTAVSGVNLGGGLKSNNNVVEAATQMGTSLTPSATVSAALFTAGTAVAVPVTATPTKIGTVVVTHGQTMNVPTAAALEGYIVVTVTGVNAANAPAQFQFIPTAAQLTAITSTSFTITLPTQLVYANVHAVSGVNVQYTAAGATKQVFMSAPAAPAVAAALAAGNIDARIPLSATALTAAFTTMDLKGTITDAAVGDAVVAYLAKWVETPSAKTRAVSVGNGKVSNNATDRVAMDLALEFGAGAQATLATLIKTERDKVAPAAAPIAGQVVAPKAAVPGVSGAVAQVAPKPILVYVQLARSNDAVQSGTATGNTNSVGKQQSLLASAILSTSSTDAAFATADPIYQVSVDPISGAISGRLTGQLAITETLTDTGLKERGLHYLDANGDVAANQAAGVWSIGVVGTGGAFQTMIGANTGGGGANFTNKLAGAFVVLHHKSSAAGNTLTELTSVDPGASNFLPFSADLTRAGTRVTIPAFTLANVRKVTLSNSTTSWQLVGLGNPSRAAAPAGNISPASLPRMFENTVSNKGFWTDHAANVYPAANSDVAMALSGNRIGVATEVSSDGNTMSIINNSVTVPPSANLVNNSWAIALLNPGTAADNLYVLQKTAAATTLGAGWSLVTVPGTPGAAVTSLGAGVEAIIRVGAQAASQFTWMKTADGATLPASLKAGEAVFVYSKTGGAL